VKPHQLSDEASQQGAEAQCHVGNDASEHKAETGFSLVLLASVVHAEVELCVRTSSLRRQLSRAAAFNTEDRTKWIQSVSSPYGPC